MRIIVCLLALFLSNCVSSWAGGNFDNSPAKKAERAEMCKKLCNKDHYNIKLIRVDGTIEEHKINIVSISDKVACECKF
ncbi:MAG: hypothetical protein V1661_01940 [bacterium]